MLIECHFADIHIFCEIVDFQLAEFCFSNNGFYFFHICFYTHGFSHADKYLPLLPFKLIITNVLPFIY